MKVDFKEPYRFYISGLKKIEHYHSDFFNEDWIMFRGIGNRHYRCWDYNNSIFNYVVKK